MNNAAQTALSDNNSFSVRKTAYNFDISEFTLCGHLHDCLSCHKGQISKQLLLSKKELNLMNVLVHLTEQEWAPSLSMIHHITETLIQAWAENSKHMMSKNWFSCFLKRHSELNTAWSTDLNKKCAVVSTSKWVKFFLLSLQKLHQKYGVLSEDIYNMNEKECVLSFNECVQVMIHQGHCLTDWQWIISDNRDYVTVVEEVSTTGFLISLLVIFKDKKMSVKWGEGSGPKGKLVLDLWAILTIL